MATTADGRGGEGRDGEGGDVIAAPSARTTRRVSRTRGSSRRRPAWLPDQHGAWAMLVLPFAAGVWLAGPAWVHVPLLLLWLSGYVAYAAASRWLRARRRRRLLPPVLAFGGATAVFAVATGLAAPHLLPWAAAYFPLLSASLWLAARGQERSLANDGLAVAAAALMAAVAFDAAGGEDWAALWTVAGVLFAYFLGTVLYVKTMIRERGRRGYVVASVAYHLAGAFGAAALALTGLHSWGLPLVWAALAARAAAGPAVNAHRARPLRPAVVGLGEIAASLLVTVVAVAGVGTGG